MSYIDEFFKNLINPFKPNYMSDIYNEPVTNSKPFDFQEEPVTRDDLIKHIDEVFRRYSIPYQPPAHDFSHYPLKISNYFFVDGWISKALDDMLVEIMENTLKFMPELDTRGWKLLVVNMTHGALAGVNENVKSFYLSPTIAYIHPDDIRFTIYHELRHIWQSQVGAHELKEDENGRPEHHWFDGTICTAEETNSYLNALDYPKYHQLPWEADANGFAHHIMGSYIPHDEVLAESIKFSTDPRFLNYVPVPKNY